MQRCGQFRSRLHSFAIVHFAVSIQDLHPSSKMKFLAVLVAAAIATVSAADVPNCDLAKLMAVSATTAAGSCKTETGFTPSFGTLPEPDKLVVICKNTNCQTTLTALGAANPTDCLLNGISIRSILDKFTTACKAVLNPTTAPTTTTSTVAPATTAAPTTTVTTASPSTTTPAPTTTKPASATSTPAAGANVTTTAPNKAPQTNTATEIPSGRCTV